MKQKTTSNGHEVSRTCVPRFVSEERNGLEISNLNHELLMVSVSRGTILRSDSQLLRSLHPKLNGRPHVMSIIEHFLFAIGNVGIISAVSAAYAESNSTLTAKNVLHMHRYEF